ncbi:hypothetical protein AGMMS49546_31280 [Spirochaetia bacterium]|nr:hypothetical protein AGMMS49546_31280 [Spirochaetia bacterium]
MIIMRISSVFSAKALVFLLLGISAFPGISFGEMLEVSRAAYLPGERANAQGVYPVRITWKKPAGESPAAYHVYRSGSPNGEFLKITPAPIDAAREVGGQFTWADPNPAAKPGEFYYYRVWYQDAQGQGAFFPGTMAGFGALGAEQYFLEYNKTLKSSHSKITHLSKSNPLDKVGSETQNGNISGGLSYACRLVRGGLGGARVTIRYENYADFYIGGDPARGVYFSITGDANSTVNMASTGVMDGTITVTGMYPGKVHYDKVQIKSGDIGGGSYEVEPAGFPRTEIKWMAEVRK